MASKKELQEQAKRQGVKFNSKTTKDELEKALGFDGGEKSPKTSAKGDNQVEVSKNENQEVTSGTTVDSDKPVQNTDSIPQNGATEIKTSPEEADNPVAKKADEARTKDDVKFADEANPNQKARNEATEQQAYDQDGNPRTGGKSSGVSADDTRGTVHDKRNDGQAPKEGATAFDRVRSVRSDQNTGINSQQNNEELGVEDQQKLEEELSDPANGIAARVITSVGSYVKVKYFYNNKPLGTYKSRDFDKADAQRFLSDLKENAGL